MILAVVIVGELFRVEEGISKPYKMHNCPQFIHLMRAIVPLAVTRRSLPRIHPVCDRSFRAFGVA